MILLNDVTIPLPMYALHSDGLKMTERIRSEQQCVVQFNSSFQISSGNDRSDAGHRVRVVDLELGGLLVRLWTSRAQQVEEHLKVVEILPSHVGDLWQKMAENASHVTSTNTIGSRYKAQHLPNNELNTKQKFGPITKTWFIILFIER